MYLDMRWEDPDIFLSGGVEYWPSNFMALRAGLRQTPAAANNERLVRLTGLTAGLGFNWHNIYIDYAYNPGEDIAENITHFFTLSYRFSKPATAEPVVVVERLPEPEPPVRQRIFTDLAHLPLEEQILIEDLGYLGFVQGYPDGTFTPEQAMTRRELMILLVRLLESARRNPGTVDRSFPDTTTRNKELTDKAVGYGLLVGYTDGLARLDQPVRRDEAACAFARYYEIAGQALQNNLRYEDVPLHHWGYKDINLTRQYYLTRGINTRHYIPKKYMRRIDAIKILGRTKYAQSARAGLPRLEDIDPELWPLLLQFEDTLK